MFVTRTLLFPSLLLMLSLAQAAAPVLEVQDARVPEAPPVAPVLAGYLTLINPSAAPVTITAARSPEFAKVEIHEMRMADGMMSMKQLPALTIPPHGRVVLEPGGLHLMLIKPKQRLRAGDMITINLELEDGRSQFVQLPVQTPAADDTTHHHHH